MDAAGLAISLKESQNSFSRLTLVLWSATVIERFVERFETGMFGLLSRECAIGTMLFWIVGNGEWKVLRRLLPLPDQEPPALVLV